MHHWLCAGQRPPRRLHPGDQAGGSVDDERDQQHQERLAGDAGGVARGHPRQFRVRPVALRDSSGEERGRRRAPWGLAYGVDGAIFLRDWRSALVVVAQHSLALCGAIVGLWLTGRNDQSHDAGRLGPGDRDLGR